VPPPPQKITSLVSALLEWFSKSARDLPWRRTRDPYGIWVSEIMLQQTQVKTVIPYWNRWMQALPTVESLAQARPEKIHKLWEGLGYYSRVRNLQSAAKRILESHRGRFPQSFEEVLELPGIGRYTAGAICSIAFDQPTPILDGNVIRVLTRVFGIAGNPREQETRGALWLLAEQLVTAADRQRPRKMRKSRPCAALNESLMELGALVCTPRQPRCGECPIARLCRALRQNRVRELPNLGRPAKPTRRRFAAFVVERSGRFLVRQRPPGAVNAQLWEFPNVEVTDSSRDPDELARAALGFSPGRLAPLCTVRHSITRYRITLEAHRARVARAPHAPRIRGRWLALSELDKFAFPSAHRTLLRRLAGTKSDSSRRRGDAERGSGTADGR
jgi:A/G-specific adenine glycosylase